MPRRTFFCLIVVLFAATCAEAAISQYQEGEKAAPLPFKGKDLPPLNVHIIAHSHDDVGWLKTVDEYYYGSNETIQVAGVQYIIDEAVTGLLLKKDRRFIYVEVAFFWRWWNEQDDEMKDSVRDLVKDGRLEFINGGWSMNDEATTHYSAIIDQMTLGHRFLKREFGIIPRIGWHIDPFGHSSSHPTLFALIGFDAFYFARIDFQDYGYRVAAKNLEFVWRPSPSLGPAVEMFTGVLWAMSYGSPQGFDFERSADPIKDNPALYDMNVEQMADNFAQQMRTRAAASKTTNLMVAFGEDFHFMNNLMFKNMDRLMKYFKAHSSEYQLKVFYSTPSLYTDAQNAANQSWSVKTDDFFPYADNANSFWTGYFTSRPAFKGYVRQCSSILHTATQLYTLGPRTQRTSSHLGQIFALQEPMGIAQHHDSVSGTAKQHVNDDYAKRLAIGSTAAVHSTIDALAHSLSPQSPPVLLWCPKMNESICDATSLLSTMPANDYLPVVIHNSLPWPRTQYVLIPVPTSSILVVNATGGFVPQQVERDPSINSKFTLVFPANLPAMGYATYFLQKTASSQPVAKQVSPKKSTTAGSSISNAFFTISFDSNNQLSSITETSTGIVTQLNQTFYKYNPVTGLGSSGQASGAYIFRPIPGTVAQQLVTKPIISVTLGTLSEVARQTFSPWVTQSVRIFKAERRIEIVNEIGPIDVSDGLGKEIISRFNTNLQTKNLFFTDSNGLEVQQRQLNYRSSWNFTTSEPIASNYYPVNVAAFIQDTSRNLQFTVVTDRSRGGASLGNGQLETMLHRRLLYDDHRGVGEPLDETTKIITVQQVLLDPIATAASRWRKQALLNSNPVSIFFGQPAPLSQWSSYTMNWSGLSTALPPQVHILSLAPLTDLPASSNKFVLRLQHLFAVGEDPTLSQAVSVDICQLFTSFTLSNIDETNLTASIPIGDVNRLKWTTNSAANKGRPSKSAPKKFTPGPKCTYSILLEPMQIRTFVITLQ